MQNQTLFRETMSFPIAAFDFATFRIDIKDPRSRRLTSLRSPNPFSSSLPLPLSPVNSRNNEARDETERNRECRSLYFTSGNFPRCGNSSSNAALRLREWTRRFDLTVEYTRNEIGLLQRALNSLIEKFRWKIIGMEMNFHANKATKSFSLVTSKRTLRTIQFQAFIKNQATETWPNFS